MWFNYNNKYIYTIHLLNPIIPLILQILRNKVIILIMKIIIIQ